MSVLASAGGTVVGGSGREGALAGQWNRGTGVDAFADLHLSSGIVGGWEGNLQVDYASDVRYQENKEDATLA